MSLIKQWFVPIFAFFLVIGCGQAEDVSELDWWPQKKYEHSSNLFIESHDGTSLVAELFKPKSKFFPGRRPAIIFANSWTLNEKQYLMQAKKFASKGYIVLSYATRGFGRSGGVASAASPNDIKDVSALIDWLENYTFIDTDRIGMIGVSYGGGIGLLSLAQEERIFTSVALSGWADLEKSLYGDDTPRKIWINLLLASGEITGNIDPEFHRMYRNLREQTDVQETREWAQLRSVSSLVDAINKKGSPVMIANSYRDNLFPPAQAMDFFSQLTVEKKFYMNRGIHASAAIPGLFGLQEGIWTNVHDWFDHWFDATSKNIYSTVLPYSFQVGDGYESYESMPKALDKSDNWPMEPVNKIRRSNSRFNFVSGRDGLFIESSRDSGASSGVPILGSVLDSHVGVKVKKWLPSVHKKYGALYYSNRLSHSVNVRGIPRVSFMAKSMSEHFQAVVYLYEVNWKGEGTLITHGVKTLRGMKPGDNVPVSIDLATIAHDVNPGRKLAVVIDTYDALYDRPQGRPFGFQIIHDSESQLKLDLPQP